MSLYDICVWIHDTSIGTAIRESTLMFPVIEGTHLLAMGASAGIIAFSDLRLLGWVMKKQPVSEVMGRLLPWAIGGFVVVMVTGILLFWADAESLYRNRTLPRSGEYGRAPASATLLSLPLADSLSGWDTGTVGHFSGLSEQSPPL